MNRLFALVALVLFLVDAAALFVWWTYPPPARRSVPDLPPAVARPAAQPLPQPAPQASGTVPPALGATAPATDPASMIVNTSKGPMKASEAISIIAFAPPQAQACIAQIFGPNAVARLRAGEISLNQENVTKAEECLDARGVAPAP